ncbi:hypothetical protein BKA64DRAFT_635842 [Cadophora sp. MPI-SDFR-AT-0126]|nr:hypothetical protein BKA64DRAFT_635842 [Leotiomycetes sp. MPI-SDFR-AT-0126]
MEIERRSTPLPEPYIIQVACGALEELWTVEIEPDILVNPSVTLSPTKRKLLHSIAGQLTHKQRLLLCCIKWEFNANEAIDPSWAFYFGQRDQDYSNPVKRYNAQTGDQMSIELASSYFAQIKEIAEVRLRVKYCLMDVARTFLQLRLLFHDADRIDYICNEVYNFCFACRKHPARDITCDLLRHWYIQKRGWFDIAELKIMIANPGRLVTPADFHRALKIATVACCGLAIPAIQALIQNQTLQIVIDYLQCLSECAALQDSTIEGSIPGDLNEYIRDLRRQLSSRVSNNVKSEGSEDIKLRRTQENTEGEGAK